MLMKVVFWAYSWPFVLTASKKRSILFDWRLFSSPSSATRLWGPEDVDNNDDVDDSDDDDVDDDVDDVVDNNVDNDVK